MSQPGELKRSREQNLTPDEDSDPEPLPRNRKYKNCEGCKYDHASQYAHMGPGGCLHSSPSSSLSVSQ